MADQQRMVVEERVRTSPSGGELARRIIVVVFGIIQALLVLRVVLLLLDANRSNDVVKFIYDLSLIFVAPFQGMLNSDALKSGGSVLDIAAILAIVGWTVLEFLLLALVGVFRREP